MRSARRIPLAIAALAVATTMALTPPASAEAAFGAIAINPNTGGAGLSWNHRTKSRAKRRARRECPGRCYIAVWMRNHCGAVVKGRRGRYVAGLGATKKRAIRKARKRANRRRAPRVAWVCSG